jgi:hypothetical protein
VSESVAAGVRVGFINPSIPLCYRVHGELCLLPSNTSKYNIDITILLVFVLPHFVFWPPFVRLKMGYYVSMARPY